MSRESVESELVRLVEEPVRDDEIDHNGHMSQFFYAERAGRASGIFMERLGLEPAALEALGARFFIVDAFTRFYREQMAGAPLATVSGVLSADAEDITLYHEIHNTAKGEVSAVFRQKVKLLDAASRAPKAFPDAVLAAAKAHHVVWPEIGRPRTLDLRSHGRAVTMAELERRGHGTEPRHFFLENPHTIRPEECDGEGYVIVMPGRGFNMGRMPTPEERETDPNFQEHMRQIRELRIGWVALETRSSVFAFPRAGERIKSFSAITDLRRKTRTRKTWAFNLTTGVLASTNEQVDLAFDLDKRKGIEITPVLLERFNEKLDTELA